MNEKAGILGMQLVSLFILCLFPPAIQAASPSQISIPQQLIGLVSKIQDHEAQLTRIEQELNQAHQEEQAVLTELNQRNQQLMDTIDYLRHAAQYSPLLAMLSAAKPEDIIHSSILMRSVVPEINARNQHLLEKIKQLSSIRSQLEVKQTQLHDITFHYHQEHERLQELLQARPQTLNQPPPPASRLTSDQAGGMPLITCPVVGVIIPTYGNTSPEWSAYSQGILLTTRSGAHAVSPLSGTIAFAGDYAPNQGKMVIIQAQNSHVVLSGLGTLNCKPGEAIMEGEPIGRMPQNSLKGNQAPIQLYVEVWHQEQTINPQTVIKR